MSSLQYWEYHLDSLYKEGEMGLISHAVFLEVQGHRAHVFGIPRMTGR